MLAFVYTYLVQIYEHAYLVQIYEHFLTAPKGLVPGGR